MTIYMKADGVHGGVTAKGHEKWIQIESYRFSASRNINTRTGRVSDREGSIPSFSEIILNKFVDQSSADLHTKMFQGASLPTVQIDICYTGTELTPHIQYTLSNVIISHIGETATSSEGEPLETLHLNYTKIEKKFITRDNSNKPQAPKSVGYDLETAQLA